MGFGKTIELFLVNGTADSLMTAELSNWNGKAIKIPRTEVSECSRSDIRGVGVYFLFCQEANGTDSVYIGEAENVYDRLCQHLRDFQAGKESFYWNTAVIFVGRDLNKAHIRYLENKLFEAAKESGRYQLLTKSTFKNTVLKESQIASMDEFTENIRVLINTLGYKVLVPMPQPTDDTIYLYCSGNGSSGKGFLSSGGFTVLKGSKVSDHTTSSVAVHGKGYYELRLQLENEEVIKDRIFQKDYEFSSPSAAATVIQGRNSNGNLDWKTSDGKNLKEL